MSRPSVTPMLKWTVKHHQDQFSSWSSPGEPLCTANRSRGVSQYCDGMLASIHGSDVYIAQANTPILLSSL